MKHLRENNPANRSVPSISRRRLLQAAASGLTLLVPGAAIATAVPTAVKPRGPFYPDRIPLDKDNDLIVRFEPSGNPRTEKLRARFDIVLS